MKTKLPKAAKFTLLRRNCKQLKNNKFFNRLIKFAEIGQRNLTF